MNIFLTILFVIILLAIIIGIIYIHLYNKINESIIRIDEAEVRIDGNLRDKYDLMTKVLAQAKSLSSIDSKKFSELAKLKIRKISNFDMDRTLDGIYNELTIVCNNDKKIRDDDEIYKMNKQITLIDEELLTLRNYYNANITLYNKLVKKIPTNIVAKIKKYKERPFYDLKNMHDDDYEDFKL